MCKMAVLGRGSVRDRKKEEELRLSGDPRYTHLFEDLHVEISTFAAPAEAHARIAYALAEVRRFLVPVSIGCFFIQIFKTDIKLPIYFYNGVPESNRSTVVQLQPMRFQHQPPYN